MRCSWRSKTLHRDTMPSSGSSKMEPSRLMDEDPGLSTLAEREVFSRPSESSGATFSPSHNWHSNDLHASVRGYPNNIYRCCESVEEGRRALDKYLSKRPEAPTLPLVSSDAGRSKSPVTKPASPHLAEHPIPDAPKDESWWCCFAGAEPGVYMGLYVITLLWLPHSNHRCSESLTRAFPAPGGVRRVNSEEEGWNLWTAFLADGRVQVVPRE